LFAGYSGEQNRNTLNVLSDDDLRILHIPLTPLPTLIPLTPLTALFYNYRFSDPPACPADSFSDPIAFALCVLSEYDLRLLHILLTTFPTMVCAYCISP
jgi:hypothetical protein